METTFPGIGRCQGCSVCRTLYSFFWGGFLFIALCETYCPFSPFYTDLPRCCAWPAQIMAMYAFFTPIGAFISAGTLGILLIPFPSMCLMLMCCCKFHIEDQCYDDERYYDRWDPEDDSESTDSSQRRRRRRRHWNRSHSSLTQLSTSTSSSTSFRHRMTTLEAGLRRVNTWVLPRMVVDQYGLGVPRGMFDNAPPAGRAWEVEQRFEGCWERRETILPDAPRDPNVGFITLKVSEESLGKYTCKFDSDTVEGDGDILGEQVKVVARLKASGAQVGRWEGKLSLDGRQIVWDNAYTWHFVDANPLRRGMAVAVRPHTTFWKWCQNNGVAMHSNHRYYRGTVEGIYERGTAVSFPKSVMSSSQAREILIVPEADIDSLGFIVDAPEQDDAAGQTAFLTRSATEIRQEYNEDCTVCMDKLRSCILIPCGHQCTCESCATELLRRHDKCPICRSAFKKFFKVQGAKDWV